MYELARARVCVCLEMKTGGDVAGGQQARPTFLFSKKKKRILNDRFLLF